MKNLFHKLFSLTMVFLLLLSTISWTVEKHLCMGRVMDVGVFTHADDCCLGLDALSTSDEPIEDKKSCCDNEVFIMQGQDDLTYHETDLDFPLKIFLYSYASTYVGLFVETEYDILCNVNPPPLLTEDLHILHEVFLI
ncbi:HYC_CC_PP family protein [Maribacter dokdonensis]|uniref:HYC_CC_PP family protein n=1 Tax=Maribacter dokdonensis TaxID=320912 RepID=UPI002AB0F7D4|nr:hypothetical protein [Maribacter dokdonensis]